MRFSRPCYDKPHRCPGWAGGGMHYPNGWHKSTHCDNGHIQFKFDKQYYKIVGHRVFRFSFSDFWFGTCNKCDVVTWPWVTRKLDPTWWRSEIKWRLTRLRWWWEDR